MHLLLVLGMKNQKNRIETTFYFTVKRRFIYDAY